MGVAFGQWEMLLLELLIPPVLGLSVCKDKLMLGVRAWLQKDKQKDNFQMSCVPYFSMNSSFLCSIIATLN